MGGVRFSVVFIILLIGIHSTIRAQIGWVSLNGKVVDNETHLPLSFASIRVHQKNTGTVSNEDGNFVFKVPVDQLQDSLEISFVGYQTAYLTAAAVSSSFKTIFLEPAVQTLNEVTVRSKTGLDLVKEFIARIPENYDTAARKMQAFYREAVNLGRDSLNFSEAVLDVYKSSYTKDIDKDQMNLLKGRKAKVNWRGDPMYGWLSNLSNGAGNSLRGDMVKNYKFGQIPLNPAEFRYYTYSLENTIDQGNKSLYVVAFAPTPKMPRSHNSLEGKFYFNTQSIALERIEWHLTEQGIHFLNRQRGYGYPIMAVAYQVSVRFSDGREVLSWAELNGRWYFKDAQRDISARVTSRKRKMINTKWNVKSVFVITTVEPGIAKPWNEKDNIMNQAHSIPTLMNGKGRDPAFWEHYNIVQPTYIDTIGTKEKKPDTVASAVHVSNRQNGFTRADTLHGKLTPLRTCYDVTFYHLDVRVHPETESIEGSSSIRFKVVQPFKRMQIDLYENMKIGDIIWKDRPLSFSREYGAVYVDFPVEQRQGDIQEITVHYSGKPQQPNFSISMNGGFLWSKSKNGKPWIQVVCQGSGSSLWWPNKDHLSDEPDSARITVTVPKGLKDISNGRLRSTTELPGDLTRFDWYVSYPINNYNITLNIGDYSHARDYYKGLNDSLTLDYYYMAESEEKARMVFKKVKPMLKLFEKDFGPYPFPRDGFTLMESLYPMEHQSAVSIGKMNGEKKDSMEMQSIIQLMYHEVSHEWWGNSVSIKDYADFWVHEAFATYAESLRLESVYGYKVSADQMNVQAIRNKEPITGVYDVNHIFYEIGDIYNKGCLMLNTLRHVINNDTLWFGVLKGIQKKFKYQTITGSDIENYICQRTKTDYHYFFDQYLRWTQPPKLIIHVAQAGTSVVLKYKWEADVKDFRMPVKVTLAKDHFGFIYPTTEMKSITIPNMATEDFEVDRDDFYMALEED